MFSLFPEGITKNEIYLSLSFFLFSFQNILQGKNQFRFKFLKCCFFGFLPLSSFSGIIHIIALFVYLFSTFLLSAQLSPDSSLLSHHWWASGVP